ncbi:MAG: polysaccharide biosynthesis tyrosine autokinase [Bacteroidota bacterium]
MKNNNNISTATEKRSEVIRVDFQKVLAKMLSYWWLFLLGLIIAVGGAKIYLRYATPEYSARAILLIKDAGQSGNISAQDIIAANDIWSGGKAMDNEIQILNSLTLMEKVVSRLKLNIQYYRIGNFKETDIYKETPFFLDSLELARKDGFGVTFFIELNDYHSFLLKRWEEDPGTRYYFGVPFENEAGRFTINLNPREAVVKGGYRLEIGAIEPTAYAYKSKVQVQRIGDVSSSVLELSLMDPVGQKASDILNTLIDVYNEEEIKDENKVFDNTLEFIDSRVEDLVVELDSVEGGIQRFKSSNEIISESASSSMDYTLDEIRGALREISNYEIQKNVLQSLENFLLQDNFETNLIPANLIAESPVLTGLVSQHNELVISNKQLAATASKQNPTRMVLEEQIADTRDLILRTIQNLKRDIQIPIQAIENNIRNLKRSMSSIPGIEKKLLEKMRTQEVKEKLFLFLLQKREETALSEAVTTAKTRTIDRARTPKFPVYPQPNLILVASGLLGLVVPFFLVLLISTFETKVESEEMINQLTTIPVLGRIVFNKGKENIVVKHGSRSAINEMFRMLRTNLNFINHGKSKQIIMMTSSVSGEGKTFIALNLGIALSLADKKVMLLGMDLRKPKLATYLGVNQSKGITNYLVGQNEIEEITQQVAEHPNLFCITSGPIPPNPAELIISGKMEKLIETLSQTYDYILIDTPPIGLVSDALLLRGVVDNILVIVRHKFTRKVMLRNLENMYQNGELKNVSLIFNGVKQGGKYYGYGGYYYGKNQGYYVDQ